MLGVCEPLAGGVLVPSPDSDLRFASFSFSFSLLCLNSPILKKRLRLDFELAGFSSSSCFLLPPKKLERLLSDFDSFKVVALPIVPIDLGSPETVGGIVPGTVPELVKPWAGSRLPNLKRCSVVDCCLKWCDGCIAGVPGAVVEGLTSEDGGSESPLGPMEN